MIYELAGSAVFCVCVFLVFKILGARPKAVLYRHKKLSSVKVSGLSLPLSVLWCEAVRILAVAGAEWKFWLGEVSGRMSFELQGISMMRPSFYAQYLNRALYEFTEQKLKLAVKLGKNIEFCIKNSWNEEFCEELRVILIGSFNKIKHLKSGQVQLFSKEDSVRLELAGSKVETKIERGEQRIEFRLPVRLKTNEEQSFILNFNEAQEGRKRKCRAAGAACNYKSFGREKIARDKIFNNEEKIARDKIFNDEEKVSKNGIFKIDKRKLAVENVFKTAKEKITRQDIFKIAGENFGVFNEKRFCALPDFKYLKKRDERCVGGNFFGHKSDKSNFLKARFAQDALKRENFKLVLPKGIDFESYFDVTERFVAARDAQVCFLSKRQTRLKVNLSGGGFSEYIHVKRIKTGLIIKDLYSGFEFCLTSNAKLKKCFLYNHFGFLYLLLEFNAESGFCLQAGKSAQALSSYQAKIETLRYQDELSKKLLQIPGVKTIKYKNESQPAKFLNKKLIDFKNAVSHSSGLGLWALIERENLKALLGEENCIAGLYKNLNVDLLDAQLRFELVSACLTSILTIGDNLLLNNNDFRRHIVECLKILDSVSPMRGCCFIDKVLPFIADGRVRAKLLSFLQKTIKKHVRSNDFEYFFTFILGCKLRQDKLFFKPHPRAGEFCFTLNLKGKEITMTNSSQGKQLRCNGMILGNMEFINLSANEDKISLEY